MNDKIFYVLVTAFTVVLFGGILFFATRPTVSNQNPNTQQQTTVESSELVGDSPNVKGDLEKAKVVVVEFADFQCPACKGAWGELARIPDDFGEDVAVVYRQFPLTSIHNYAYNASLASEAAAKQGKFFEYHDLLFRNQADTNNPLTDEDFISFAQELELDVDQFKSDMDSDEIRDQVKEDMAYADSLGLNSTPTIYVDGVQVPYPQVISTIRSKLDSMNTTEATDSEEMTTEVSPTPEEVTE